jgi:hypothetical protein
MSCENFAAIVERNYKGGVDWQFLAERGGFEPPIQLLTV